MISKSDINEYFSFAKYLINNYKYSDNTKDGDIYKNIRTGKMHTEKQIIKMFELWKKIRK